MSIRNSIAEKIEKIRQHIGVWDDPKSSREEKAEALAKLVGNDPAVWSAIAAVVSRKPMTRFGEKGVARTEAKSSVASALLAVENPKPARQKVVPKPVSATAPARVLDEPMGDEVVKTWVGFLTGITRGSKIPWETCQRLTSKLFTGGFLPTLEQWNLLFSAMKKANEVGRFIVGNSAKPAEIFASAPAELLEDYLFGQEGIVPHLTGEVKDAKVGGMPAWLCAKLSICLDAIEVLDEKRGLDEQEENLVGKFIDAIEGRNPPDWLFEKGRAFWGSSEGQLLHDPKWKGDGRMATALSKVS